MNRTIKIIGSTIILLSLVWASQCGNAVSKVSPPRLASVVIDSNTPPPPPPGSRGIFLSFQELNRFLHEASPNLSKHGIGKPFNTLVYDKVIAYSFEGHEERYPFVLDGGVFAPVVYKQQQLDESEVQSITALLTSPSTYGGSTAACFEPRLALIFYKGTQATMQVSICLGCNYLEATSPIPAVNSIKAKDADYYQIGFSKQGRQGLKALCDKYGFYYEKNSSHDE